MKNFNIRDIIILTLLIVIVFGGTSQLNDIKTLKQENKELERTISSQNKQLDALSVDLSNKQSEIFRNKILLSEQEIELYKLKKNNKQITIKYEKVLANYNTLGDSAKWQYFRTIINN